MSDLTRMSGEDDKMTLAEQMAAYVTMRERAEKAEALAAQGAEELAAMRFKIHTLEQHNQHFERCESAWCHPSDKQWGNPALETFRGAKARAETAESERDQARAERDGLEILYKAEFKLVTALNGQLSTARTALTEISRLAQRGEEKPEIIMKNRFGLIRIASRGALDALTPPEAATSEKAE